MKKERQAAILNIISGRAVETQQDLQDALEELGYFCTQATISRDIKELHLVKAPTGHGNYRYAPTGGRGLINSENRLRTIFRESVTSFDYAQNIVVMKTMPGLAPAACANLDQMELADIVGTIAGDDTALLIMRNEAAAAAFCREIKNMLE
ncbi:MAG: arginine repressor [Oscillospiraceae bacterium]|nr:arginine repressor [Oscillospiraceae bacterium]